MKTWLLGATLALGAIGTASAGTHEHFHLRHEHTYPRYHPPVQEQQQNTGNATQSSPSADAPPRS